MGNYFSDNVNQNDIIEITDQLLGSHTPYNKYGWKPDLPDIRDLSIAFQENPHYSKTVDLRKQCPPIYDQGNLGSCTANAIAAAYQFDEMRQENSDSFMPSRLFIYYNERKMEGSTDTDSGANIRDGIKSINRQGVCHESIWPYDISKFAVEPDQVCYSDAKYHKSLIYHRVKHNCKQIRAALHNGYPVVFGISVYQSFENEEVAKAPEI